MEFFRDPWTEETRKPRGRRPRFRASGRKDTSKSEAGRLQSPAVAAATAASSAQCKQNCKQTACEHDGKPSTARRKPRRAHKLLKRPASRKERQLPQAEQRRQRPARVGQQRDHPQRRRRRRAIRPGGDASRAELGIEADLVTASPRQGCEALSNAAKALTQIVVMYRGGCSFRKKLENAEAAGAAA